MTMHSQHLTEAMTPYAALGHIQSLQDIRNNAFEGGVSTIVHALFGMIGASLEPCVEMLQNLEHSTNRTTTDDLLKESP